MTQCVKRLLGLTATITCVLLVQQFALAAGKGGSAGGTNHGEGSKPSVTVHFGHSANVEYTKQSGNPPTKKEKLDNKKG